MRLAYQFQDQKVKGQRSRTPCPLMLTPIVRYIFRTARSTNFKLGTRMEGDDRISHRCTTSKVKVARSRDQSELSWPNVSLAAGGAYRSAEPGGHTSCSFVSYIVMITVSQNYCTWHNKCSWWWWWWWWWWTVGLHTYCWRSFHGLRVQRSVVLNQLYVAVRRSLHTFFQLIRVILHHLDHAANIHL